MHLESNLELQKFLMSRLAMKYLLPIKTPEWSAHLPALAAVEPRQAGRQVGSWPECRGNPLSGDVLLRW